MKMKLAAAGLIIATSMVVAVGPIQAACFKNKPGWHMVSKKCNISPAQNWRQYESGVYMRPATGKSLIPTL
jgi:hypothetical protein